jgi:hypothetical protein
MTYNHKEYMKQYNQRKKKELQEYWKTPKGRKTKRITSTRRTLDHSHITGYYRFICCHSCNTKIRFQETRFKKVIQEIASNSL